MKFNEKSLDRKALVFLDEKYFTLAGQQNSHNFRLWFPKATTKAEAVKQSAEADLKLAALREEVCTVL